MKTITLDDLMKMMIAELEQSKIDLEEYRRDVEELRAALKPFAAAADIVVPHIDMLCGNGFYESLLKAKAVLNEGAK